MTDIAALKAKYFLDEADAHPPSEPVPKSFANSDVAVFVDGQPYFDDLANELASIGSGSAAASNGHFILIANWWLGLAGGRYVPAASSVPGAMFGSGTPSVANNRPLRLAENEDPLIDLLKAKARNGVDVRVLGWVSFAVMGTVFVQQFEGASEVAQVNSMTMESIKSLRSEPAIGAQAMLNVIGHSAGSAHTKLVVLGTPQRAVAYTGGIDFVENRKTLPNHPDDQTWHDAMAKVEGPAVQGLYDWFKDMWAENLRRPVKRFKYEGETMPSFLPHTPALKAQAMPVPNPATGPHHIQSLRTVPQFNYTTLNCMPENEPISFAPQGIFEFRAAARKALRAATSLIYIEDQGFWSHETLSWVRDAVKENAGLHVVLLTAGAKDPTDPKFPFSYIANAVNHGLLRELTAEEKGRVRLFRRLAADLKAGSLAALVGSVNPIAGTDRGIAQTALQLAKPLEANVLEPKNLFLVSAGGVRYPVVGNAATPANTPVQLTVEQPPGAPAFAPGAFQLREGQGLTVHAKLTIVDDECLIVGSANCLRRSLYGDLEHSITVLEEGEMPLAKGLRMELWAHHLGGNPADYGDLDVALHAWDPAWGTPGGRSRPSTVRNWALPLVPDAPLKDHDKRMYDWYHDIDSREPWGGLCPPT